MTAPVDVLAVMQDDMRAASERRSDTMGLQAATAALHKSWSAHDAVAELIAVDDRIIKGSRKKAGGGFWVITNADMEALRAALARVGGGAR